MTKHYSKWRKLVVELIGGDYYDERDYLEWYDSGKTPEYVLSLHESLSVAL